MKIIDYITQNSIEVSSDWRDYLEQHGYIRPPSFPPDDDMTLALVESLDQKRFAVYHPPVGHLKTECLYINIPSEEEAESLLDFSTQIIQGALIPLTLVSSVLNSPSTNT